MTSKKKSSDQVLKLSVKPQYLDWALGVLFQHGIFTLEQKNLAKKIHITAELPLLTSSLKMDLKKIKVSKSEALFQDIKIIKVRNRKWAEEYKKSLKKIPFIFRNSKDQKYPERALLWIDPRNKKSSPSTNTLYLEAGLAFGTGSHPTTWLCAQALAEHLQKYSTKKVLDLGCGTGLLAMVAAKLGAKKIWAIDNDPVALEVAQENFAKNQTLHIHLQEDLSKSPRNFDLIVANILLTTLLELKNLIIPRLAKKGILIASGLLYKDCAELTHAYQKAGLKLLQRKNRKGWSALIFERK